MKITTKTKSYQWIALLISVLIISACSKEDAGNGFKGQEVTQSIGVTVNFDASNQPAVGDELNLNFYYSDISGKNRLSIKPDFSFEYKLTQNQIDNGFEVPFNSFEKKDEVYIGAHIDTDGNGEINSGDYTAFYKEKSLADVEAGEKLDNVANEEAIALVVGSKVKEVIVEKVKDYDGNEYETVVIGDQVWLVENLKVTHYNNGDPIATDLNENEWAATTEGAYAVYPYQEDEDLNSEKEMISRYGLLYNNHTVQDSRGIAPEGYRVPTDEDWIELEMAVGMSEEDANAIDWRGEVGPDLKGTEYWRETDNGKEGIDDYGFNALPTGYRHSSKGTFGRHSEFAYFWTSTPSSSKPDLVIRRLLRYNYASINRSKISKNEGSSIRCVKIK